MEESLGSAMRKVMHFFSTPFHFFALQILFFASRCSRNHLQLLGLDVISPD